MTDTRDATANVVLRLLVRNHAGVMSHVCGLFARRAFNVERIVCLPLEDDSRSVVLLQIDDDERVEQLVRQLRKLEDVLEVERAPQLQHAFAALSSWITLSRIPAGAVPSP